MEKITKQCVTYLNEKPILKKDGKPSKLFVIGLEDGKNYSGFGDLPKGLSKQDLVSFEYELNGEYRNVKGEVINHTNHEEEIISDKSVGADHGGGFDHRTKDIHYQVCLKISSEILSKFSVDVPKPEEVIAYAKELLIKGW